ncbi:MAG: aldolase/citrate lyase family protein [Sphingomonadaceae bacterium]|nr:aldolase/citrate lyase family protein [Sphingomonadaceae bacterium]
MNRVLERLRGGGSARAIWMVLGSVALAELAAEAGPDAIVFDRQHGTWDDAALMAAVGVCGDATPLVRVAANRPELIGAALDAGAQGVIVPLVESAAEAAAAVRAAHYPPRGVRSGGGMRPLRDMGAYVAAAATETLVAVMIETAAGLTNAAEIAATPDVDLVFIGPGDLGLAVGSAALEMSIARIQAACAEAPMASGIYTSGPDAAARRLAQGFRFVVAEDDVHLPRTGFAAALKATA